MEKTIICIGREYGSGGHEIGELLAKRTGYAFYDKEKLFEIAKMRGYEKEMQEYLDEAGGQPSLFNRNEFCRTEEEAISI